MAFREIRAEELSFNPFDKIGKEWMLITAGDEAKHNTMTASWGGLGIMWGKKVAMVYIRPQRYTISFYKEEYRKALAVCGRKSGRDCDKEKEAGLTPYYVDGTTAFEEADLVFVCRKQYHQELKGECFDVKENDTTHYPDQDYHMMYIAEIEKVLVKE